MKIKTMTARFGLLSGETLALSPGFNIIQAPNEGGKSTWCGFLKTMLYGLDTRDRDKKGYLADKNRYQPWSGAPMEGEITLEWRGRNITIRRGKQGATPFGAFSAVYAGTEEPVPGMTGENCGELLCGVGRETFERSAFIGQSGLALTSAPELEKRIAALASSGEEEVSYSQTEARLREWRNRRQVNKTVGLIPRLEGDLNEVVRTASRLDQVTAEISRCEGERVRLEAEKSELEAERLLHRKLRQHALDERFAQALEDYDAAKAALDSLRREYSRFGTPPERELLKRAQGELQYLKVLDEEIKQAQSALRQAEEAYVQANIAIRDDPDFNGLTGEEARAKARGDQETLEAHARSGAKWTGRRGLAFLPGLLLGGGLTLYGLLVNRPLFPFLCGGMGLFGGLGLLLLWRVNRRIAGEKRAQSQILARYAAQTPEQIAILTEDYARRWQLAEDRAEELKQVRAALNDRTARRENGKNDLLSFVHSFAPEVGDLFGCSAALSKALGLEDSLRTARDRLELTRRRRDDLEAQGGRPSQTPEPLAQPEHSAQETEALLAAVDGELARVNRTLDMARGEQRAVGDPAALSARQEQLEERLERRRAEYQALTVAMDALKAANARLQERFSPELNRLAGQWMGRLTGGTYTRVSLTKELEISASWEAGVLPRKALALSRGTADQLYLAVRLAVCQLCLPGDGAPLVLDDALVSFDDMRLKLALESLTELGKQRQILLFTCQSRERRALEERDGVTYVALNER